MLAFRECSWSFKLERISNHMWNVLYRTKLDVCWVRRSSVGGFEEVTVPSSHLKRERIYTKEWSKCHRYKVHRSDVKILRTKFEIKIQFWAEKFAHAYRTVRVLSSLIASIVHLSFDSRWFWKHVNLKRQCSHTSRIMFCKTWFHLCLLQGWLHRAKRDPTHFPFQFPCTREFSVQGHKLF